MAQVDRMFAWTLWWLMIREKTGIVCLHCDTFNYSAVFNSTICIIPKKTCFCPLYKNMLWNRNLTQTILAQVDLLLAWTLWWLMIRKSNKTQTLFVINFKGKWYVSVRKCRLWRILFANRWYVSVRVFLCNISSFCL